MVAEAAVVTTAAMTTTMAAAAMAKAMVMATAVTAVANASWPPWLKFVRVGRWREDGGK